MRRCWYGVYWICYRLINQSCPTGYTGRKGNKMKTYYYHKESKTGKCGCRMGNNIWYKTNAKNKQEIIKRVKRWDNVVTVFSESQMQELLSRNSKIVIY